jgi:plastocyanin
MIRFAKPAAAILVGLCLIGAFGACSNAGGASGDIVMESQRFEPQELTIAVGDTVSWANGSGETHTVTAYEDEIPDGAEFFASGGASSEEAAREDLSAGLLGESDTFEVTFDVPGTYEYFCIPHESSGMTGTIIVEP